MDKFQFEKQWKCLICQNTIHITHRFCQYCKNDHGIKYINPYLGSVYYVDESPIPQLQPLSIPYRVELGSNSRLDMKDLCKALHKDSNQWCIDVSKKYQQCLDSLFKEYFLYNTIHLTHETNAIMTMVVIVALDQSTRLNLAKKIVITIINVHL